MSLEELLGLLRRNVVLLLVFATLGLVLAFANTVREPKQYAAQASAFVSAGYPRTIEELVASAGATATGSEGLAQLAGAPQTVQAVRDRLGEASAFDSLVGVAENGVVTVTATGPSATGARDAANAAVEELVRLQTAATDADRPEGEPQSTLTTVTPLRAAAAPDSAFAPTYPMPLALGAGLGLGVGLAFALARRALDSRMRTREDVETHLGAATLGWLPASADLGEEHGLAAESLRQLRTNVRFLGVDDPPRSIVVTSANAGEGKSTISAALARSMADAGQPVVLVDADLRRSVVADRLGLDGAVGLSQVLSGEVALEDAIQGGGADGLRVLPAGRTPPNPSELLGTERMSTLVELLGARATVILDAPPLLPVTDAGLLATRCDGVLFVVSSGTTQKPQVDYAKRILDQLGVPVLGAVLNNVSRRRLLRAQRSGGRWRWRRRGDYYYGYGTREKV